MKLTLSKRTDTLLLVEPSNAGPRYVVTSSDGTELRILAEGQLDAVDEVGSLPQRLRERLQESSIHCNRAALLLSRPTIETCSGSVPPADDSELPEMVKGLVAHEIDDADERIIDFLITGRGDDQSIDILAMTYDRRDFDTATREFKDAGFTLESVTYNGLGAVELLRQVAHQKLPIAVAITATDAKTDIVVLHHGQPMLFRTIQRGVEPHDTFGPELASELQRTLAFIGAAEEDSAQIYLIGDPESLGGVAEHLSEMLSSSVSIAGVLDKVDESAVAPFTDAADYANLIGVASAINEDQLALDFVNPSQPELPPSRWSKWAMWGSVAALVLGVFGYIAWSDRAEQLSQIESKKEILRGLLKREVKSQKLQDIVNAVEGWRANEITWLDELKDVSDRFPRRSESLVRRMSLSSSGNGTGVIDLSVQVSSPDVVTGLEDAIRDGRHSVSSKRVTEVSDSQELTWSFETRIVFRPIPAPKLEFDDPDADVGVETEVASLTEVAR